MLFHALIAGPVAFADTWAAGWLKSAWPTTLRLCECVASQILSECVDDGGSNAVVTGVTDAFDKKNDLYALWRRTVV